MATYRKRGRQKHIVPTDWDGESWTCVQLQWPWSQEWFDLLFSIIENLTWWTAWDQPGINLPDVRLTAQEIITRTWPLIGCTGIPLPPVPNGPTAGNFGGLVGDCEDCDMPCIDISGLLKIENGILYARDSCCVWVEIGAIGENVPGDIGEAPFEIPEGPTPTYSGCGKAIAVVEAIWRVGDAGLDQVLSLPFLYEQAVQNQSGININSRHALSMQVIALEFVVGWTPQVFDPQIKQDWICTLSQWFEDDANGMNSETVAAFKKHILASKWANIVDKVLASAYWLYVVDAIRASQLNNIAKLGATNISGDCDCPGLALPPPFPMGEMIYDVIPSLSAVSTACPFGDPAKVFTASAVANSHIRGTGETTTNPNQLCDLGTLDEPGITVLAGDEVWILPTVYSKGVTTSFNLELGVTQHRTGGDTEVLELFGDDTETLATPNQWSKLITLGGDPATLTRVYGQFKWYADGETLDFKLEGLIIRRP